MENCNRRDNKMTLKTISTLWKLNHSFFIRIPAEIISDSMFPAANLVKGKKYKVEYKPVEKQLVINLADE